MRYTINKNHVYSIIGLILYRISLDYTYTNIISVLFDYQFFRNEPTTLSLILSWVFLVSLTPVIAQIFSHSTLSSNILSILILVSLVPTTTMIAYNGYYPIKYALLIYIYWFLVLHFNLYFPKIIIKKGGIKYLSNSNLYKYITVILCLSVLFLSWKFTGFRFHFGLLDVYDIRADARNYEVSFVLGYLSTFSDNLLPVLLVFYMNKNRKLMSCILILVILLNFGFTATKQILFLLVLALFGFFFVKTLKVIQYSVWFLLSLILLCIFEFKIFHSNFITIFSTYRILFIPAKLQFLYYDFFSVRELDYFRQSLLKWVLNSPYKENIGFILGEYDIGDIAARANNGLFSDAYMNLGVIGVFIFPVIVIVILKLLDGAADGLPERMLFIIVASVAFVLLGLPFTTALFSAGIIALIVFLESLPRETIKS